MRSGLLNERMTVYAKVTSIDANGAKSVTLNVLGTYWCRVLRASRDRNDADVDRVVYNPITRFELRASVPIADSAIIEHDGLKYVISTIEKNHNIDSQILNCERYEQ